MHTMTTCNRCDRTLDASDLVRHEDDGLLIVHCPGCGNVLGVYKQHRQRPKTDTLRA